MMVRKSIFAILCCVFVLCFTTSAFCEAAKPDASKESAKPVTTSDPYIEQDELVLILNAYTKEELLVEATGWMELLRAKAVEIGKAEIAVKRQNEEIAKAAEIQEQAQKAAEELEQLEEDAQAAEATGEKAEIKETEEKADEVDKIVDEMGSMIDEAAQAAEKTAEVQGALHESTTQKIDETMQAADKAEGAMGKVKEAVSAMEGENSNQVRGAAGEAKEAVKDAQQATSIIEGNVTTALDKVEQQNSGKSAVAQTQATMKEVEETKKEAKNGLLETLATLREERTVIGDNFKAVIAELTLKTPKTDSTAMGLIDDYNLYSSAVQGIHLDVTDATSSFMAVKGWITSDEGGIRFGLNLLKFGSILVGAWMFAAFAGRIAFRALGKVQNISMLLRDFLSGTMRWGVLVAGTIMALAAMEFSIAPLLTMIGAAGFIIALALQDSLSNFASGIMILFFRPFDVDDYVEAGGVAGMVTSMSLVSTTIRTADNKRIMVPNNKVWQDVITNVTGVATRRVDMEFGIGYEDDIDKAQKVLEDIVTSHPKVLKDPEYNIRVHLLADSSVNFICRPWVRSVDYWEVYWDITREVKLRFDQEGLNIPYPQQDVHLFVEGNNPQAI